MPVKTVRCLIVSAALALLAVGTSIAADPTQPRTAAEPTWQRAEALHQAAGVVRGPAVENLVDLAVSGQTYLAMRALRSLVARRDWPWPAREAALLEFTVALRERDLTGIDPDILEYLAAHESRVLVPHHDNPAAGAPLFNVRAAAQGLLHRRVRDRFAQQAARQLETDPRGLAMTYAGNTDRNVRAGIERGISNGDPDHLGALLAHCLALAEQTPSIRGLAGIAAAGIGDLATLRSIISASEGFASNRLLRKIAPLLPPESAAGLLAALVREAPHAIAATAIAELSPAAIGQPGTASLLFSLLDHPQLGGTAALALARRGDGEARLQLATRAVDADPLTAARIRAALETIPDAGEAVPHP